MSDFMTLSRGEIVTRIREIDPSTPTGIAVPLEALIASLADLTSDTNDNAPDVDGDLPPIGEYVYATSDAAPVVVGNYAVYSVDTDCSIGLCGVADEDTARTMLGLMAEYFERVDTTDDKVRHCNVKDGVFKGTAPRMMAAAILGFTAEELEAPKTWATRSHLRIWETTTGEASYLADVDAKLNDVPTLMVEGEDGFVPVVRPTDKIVDFAVPVTNVQRAIAVFYRDSTEKHAAISGLRKASFLGVVPSGKAHAVKSFVSLDTIARVLVNLGVGLPSQAADSSDLPEGKRPLVMVPAYDHAVADYLESLGYDEEGVGAAMTTLANSKYALAAARASGRKVRENDESARRAQDGRHHEFRLRDGGATALADASVALARAAR